MRRLLPPLLLVALALAGCGDEAPSGSDAARFSAEVRESFLDSCLENATATSQGAAGHEQLRQTCACILGKVEQEYSEAEFAKFEQRLLAQTASDEETARLTRWSTECAEEATS